jgi:hypothetical protein
MKPLILKLTSSWSRKNTRFAIRLTKAAKLRYFGWPLLSVSRQKSILLCCMEVHVQSKQWPFWCGCVLWAVSALHTPTSEPSVNTGQSSKQSNTTYKYAGTERSGLHLRRRYKLFNLPQAWNTSFITEREHLLIVFNF